MTVFKRNKKGFTLIELVAVIAIIAILGGIVAASTVAIVKNSTKKSIASKLKSYWSITNTAFDQINKGFSTYDNPDVYFLSTRLKTNNLFIGTKECTSLPDPYSPENKNKDDPIYIQYSDNPKSLRKRYTIVQIWIRHGNDYYYTKDGKTVVGPNSTP